MIIYPVDKTLGKLDFSQDTKWEKRREKACVRGARRNNTTLFCSLDYGQSENVLFSCF